MARRDFFHTGLQVSRSQIENMLRMAYPGGVYYVSRNRGSGAQDGSSWDDAFLTYSEAITEINRQYSLAAYPTRGRNTLILFDEGWYSEVGITLTASDVTFMSVAPGSNIADGTVLYGSATAGGFDAGAVVPTITVTGSAVSFINMGFMNSASSLYPCISVGVSGSSGPTDVGFYDCFFPRDVADAYTYGIVDYGNEGLRVENCYFSQSAATGGILIATNGVTNPVNDWITNCTFIGTPIGIHQTAGHNTRIQGNWFYDASDDRADTIDNPLNIVATSGFATGNFAPNNTLAEFDAGAVAVTLGNICSDSDAADWPNGG
jgi:hypothetical protein